MQADSNQAPVEVKDLRKSFGGQKVLNGISLRASHGQIVAVLGRSGTGKSVLLKLLVGLQPADSGSIQIAGQEITDLDLAPLNEIRKKGGFPVSTGSPVRFVDCRAKRRFPFEQACHFVGTATQRQGA